MDFRTEVTPSNSASKYSLKHSFVTIGSCFSDAIGEKLQHNKFSVLANPFGTCYNPVSIHTLLSIAAANAAPPPNTFVAHNGLHANYLFHSTFTSLTREHAEQQITSALALAHQHLQRASVVIITYGTAWVYKRNDTSEIVNNCHKVPLTNFTKQLVEVSQIVDSFEAVHRELMAVNPTLQFLFTLSPVRHLRDTAELNSVSKAVLRQAIYKITNQHKNTSYFPAYEIMMDDLRDYRFYKSDMLHPTEEATTYIWDKFTHAYFNKATLDFLKEWNAIQSALAHKPFHPQSPAHQHFLQLLEQKLLELKKLSSVDVDAELKAVQSQIVNVKS